jgi:hypothetical protein
LEEWGYQKGSGLGGSAANSILMGKNSFESELNMGVGWQDPAIIKETGLCVWRSGPTPVLEIKRNPDMLKGKMGLLWTGINHCTPDRVDAERDYDLIKDAGRMCHSGVYYNNINYIFSGVEKSYEAQLKEGMEPLPTITNARAWKYCGGGWGGYALYLFKNEDHRNKSNLIPIEPFLHNHF